jgi:S-(hydroxymethyl)glutathione dehydrogenase/alcohol dehydrogenase
MDENVISENEHVVPRRAVLKHGAAVAAGSAVGLFGNQPTYSQQQEVASIVTGTQAGRRFRAWVQDGHISSGSIEELTLLGLQSRQVLVRPEASAPCYTLVQGGYGGTPMVDTPDNVDGNSLPEISNHTAVGIVEAVGPDVRRVQVGDRVVIGVVAQCGQCYMCLRGRADHCQFSMGVVDEFPPIATRDDGTEIRASIGVGGLSELTVAFEEYLCPVFTDLPPEQLSLLGDTAASGFGTVMGVMPIEPGSDVVVLGAGPVGMSAVQAARIVGAAQIIVSEPIAHRRELALRLGATTVIDPNAIGDDLVEYVRELCKGSTDRWFAGGRSWAATNTGSFGVGEDNRGPDFTIEAIGRTGDRPLVELPPDPTGVMPMQQAWEFTRRGGEICYLGFGQTGEVSYPASAFANFGRSVHAGQQGGLNMMRDIPRLVTLAESGEFDLGSMVTSTWRLEQTRQALQVVSDRTEMASVVVFED